MITRFTLFTPLVICGLINFGVTASLRAAGNIETIAGTGSAEDGGDGGPALATNVGRPFKMQIGPDGELYFVEYGTHRVRRLNLASGKLTNVAGTGKSGYTGDGGLAVQGTMNEPHELAFDRAGNLYVTDMRNQVIRKIEAKSGTISTFAGTGKAGFSGDGGLALKAQFNGPHSLCVDESGGKSLLYVADVGNNRIRRIDLKSGNIDTVAGNGESKLPTDGSLAIDSPIHGPRAIDIGQGSLWIVLREGNSVWQMNMADGRLHYVAGTGKTGFAVSEGAAKDAQFASPKGIAVAPTATFMWPIAAIMWCG